MRTGRDMQPATYCSPEGDSRGFSCRVEGGLSRPSHDRSERGQVFRSHLLPPPPSPDRRFTPLHSHPHLSNLSSLAPDASIIEPSLHPHHPRPQAQKPSVSPHTYLCTLTPETVRFVCILPFFRDGQLFASLVVDILFGLAVIVGIRVR